MYIGIMLHLHTKAQEIRKKAEDADKIAREKLGWPPKPLGNGWS